MCSDRAAAGADTLTGHKDVNGLELSIVDSRSWLLLLKWRLSQPDLLSCIMSPSVSLQTACWGPELDFTKRLILPDCTPRNVYLKANKKWQRINVTWKQMDVFILPSDKQLNWAEDELMSRNSPLQFRESQLSARFISAIFKNIRTGLEDCQRCYLTGYQDWKTINGDKRKTQFIRTKHDQQYPSVTEIFIRWTENTTKLHLQRQKKTF